MTSIFSFLRSHSEDSAGELSDEAATVEVMSSEAMADAAPTASADLSAPFGAPSLDVILANIRAALEFYLPPPAGGFPNPNVSIIKVEEKPAGLGNYIRDERLNEFSIALKGGRLQATIRFQIWAASPNDVDQAIDELHGRLLVAKNDLWAASFLRFKPEGSNLAEHVSSLDVWRRTTDFQALYEFQYTDTDGARSLIARIPIHTDPEEPNSPNRETNLITNEMARWDDESAPALDVRGRLTVSHFSALFFIPGTPPSAPIRLLRTFNGAAGAAVDFSDVEQFITAVNDPTSPERHAQFTFASFIDFLAATTPSGDPIILGDWDEDATPDSYQSVIFNLPTPVNLPGSDDHLQLIYQPDSDTPKFDQTGVLYIRAGPH
jgi:hypothetical protein